MKNIFDPAFRKIKPTEGKDYTIPQIDLSVKPEGLDPKFDYLYDLVAVDKSKPYQAHPDSVLLKNGNILCMYPAGHGKGAVMTKISTDGGRSWTGDLKNKPASWEKSRETPTVYRLQFTDGKTADKIVMISGNPKWPNEPTCGGFNYSLSSDEGETWTEFELVFDKKSDCPMIPVVALASLTQLKENGKFVDKWMGFFHNSNFNNFKTILTFDEKGNPHWSKPEKYFSAHRDYEASSNMCEVEVIRSDFGKGDELCLISRSNTKKINSLISFSQDEGKTWSRPVEAPAALNGERHKADYTHDGRLFITFRSIERGPRAIKTATQKWSSEGWVAWVGTYDDLKNGREGQYRIKLAHTYLKNQTEPQYSANADTGYCGNVVLEDGTVVTSTYGIFDNTDIVYSERDKQKQGRTFIASKRIRLEDTDELVKLVK